MLTLVLLAGAFVAFGAFVVLAYRRQWHWTGLPAVPAARTGAENRPAKTLWDWLQLLGIPVALASLAFLLTDAQSRRDQRREDQRAAQQRTTAADAERESTLRTYLAQMSNLMLGRQLLRSMPGADVRKVARTATLTAVRRLDGPRRGLVLQFLAEARLLRHEKDASARVLVASADLRAASLRGADLRGADLRGAILSGAILSEASLRGAVLSQAILREADLREADLREADLREAILTRARRAPRARRRQIRRARLLERLRRTASRARHEQVMYFGAEDRALWFRADWWFPVAGSRGRQALASPQTGVAQRARRPPECGAWRRSSKASHA